MHKIRIKELTNLGAEYNVVKIPKVYLVPEAKPKDTNIARVLLLLVNDTPIMLVPKAKSRDTNSISYKYSYSAKIPNHLLISNRIQQ